MVNHADCKTNLEFTINARRNSFVPATLRPLRLNIPSPIERREKKSNG